MEEGEYGDHIAVIIAGWIKICIHEDGIERIISKLGQGELVGERAALHMSARSATVIALETVKALVMKTSDFVAFVDRHPTVIDIIENQVYRRLTRLQGDNGPEQHRPESDALSARGLAATGHSAGRYAAWAPQKFQPMNRENCTILVTDIVAFSSKGRTDQDRLAIRQASIQMTKTALANSWHECFCENRGDGLLIIVPPNIPTATVLEQLIEGLPPALKRHNRTHSDAVRIQLRLAAAVGPIVTDNFGVCGEAIILATRLVEAPALKQAMTKGGVNLGVIASTFVYETVVRHGDVQINPVSYQQIPVNVKECNTSAWIHLI